MGLKESYLKMVSEQEKTENEARNSEEMNKAMPSILVPSYEQQILTEPISALVKEFISLIDPSVWRCFPFDAIPSVTAKVIPRLYTSRDGYYIGVEENFDWFVQSVWPDGIRKVSRVKCQFDLPYSFEKKPDDSTFRRYEKNNKKRFKVLSKEKAISEYQSMFQKELESIIIKYRNQMDPYIRDDQNYLAISYKDDSEYSKYGYAIIFKNGSTYDYRIGYRIGREPYYFNYKCPLFTGDSVETERFLLIALKQLNKSKKFYVRPDKNL